MYLEVEKDKHNEGNDLVVIFDWYPGHEDVLDSQQRDQDERGSHRLHIGVRLNAVRLPQLGNEDSDDVQEKENVYLIGWTEDKTSETTKRYKRNCRHSLWKNNLCFCRNFSQTSAD